MKTFMLLATLATASAQYTLNPGQSKCGSLTKPDNDQTKAFGSVGPCEFWQECKTITGVMEGDDVKTADDDNDYKTWYVCLNKGNTLCHRYSDLSGSGTIVATTQCTSSQKCCQGTCCDIFNKACILQTEGEFKYGWNDGQVQNQFKFNHKGETDKYWNYKYQAERVSRNDWKTEFGAVANQPKYCAPKTVYMNTGAGLKVIYIPTLGVLVTLWAIMGVKNNGKLDKSQTFMPCTMLVCALLGWFSIYQSHYMFGIIIATATACAPANWTSWVLFFQIFAFWWFLGGNSFLFNNDANSISALKPSDSDLIQNLVDNTGMNGNAMNNCATYFNFFKFDGANNGNAGGNVSPNQRGANTGTATTSTPQSTQPPAMNAGNRKYWSAGSPDREAWGYCSYEWIGFQTFLAVTNLIAFFVMVIQTVHRTMNGGDGGGSFTEAIVTRQTSKV